MTEPNKPVALILVSKNCPHCHTLEKLLRERLAMGLLGELEVINVEQSPDIAQRYGIRSVPWLKLGSFIFDEVLTPSELDNWIVNVKEGSGQSRYLNYLLEHGKLAKAIEWIEQGNASLNAVIPLLVDDDTKINVRIGIGAILEHFENTQHIKDIISDLLALLQDVNQTVRTDVCYYLSLTHSSDVIEPLKKMLDDESQQVRQVARESIEELSK